MTAARLLRLNRTAALLLAAAVFLGCLGAVLLVGQIVFLSRAVDQVFLHAADLPAILPLLGAAALCLALRSLAAAFADMLLQRAASWIKSDLRRGLCTHLFTLGPTYTHGERSGELVSTLGGGVEALDDYVTQYLPARGWALLNTGLIFAAVLWLDPPTTLVLLFAAPMLILLLALIGGQARRLTQQRFAELSWMSAFYLDILQGLTTLKLFGRSREQAANIEQISRHYGDTTLKVLATAFQSSLVMEWAATAATAMVALEVSLRLVGGTISFGPGLAVLLLTPEFFLPLRQLAIKYHAGAAAKAAGERIFAILAEPADPPGVAPVSFSSAAPIPIPAGDITFTRVSYTYPAARDAGQVRQAALHDISFVIPHGQITALVGHSGAGKTTAANLLLRFSTPTCGQITVGAVNLGSLDLAAWRAHVAWVPQRPHLFAGDVVENIRLGMPHADRDAVIAAAKAAHADEFLSRLPQGYNTPLGEGAARLSGGQRQRLAIARAFLKNAPILILDEPGANLDAESEALIRDALQRLMRGRTVLLIAHGPSLAAAANHIVKLEAGRVVMERSPAVFSVEDWRYRQSTNLAAGRGSAG